MKILYVSSECSPFIKTGGLGDVAGSLPQKIKEIGEDIRVVLPLYSSIEKQYKDKMKFIKDIKVQLSWRSAYCGIFELEYENITYYFIDNEQYFKRNNIYGEYDDGERFAFFSKACLDILPNIDFLPDVINCNDWQTGLVPVYLKLNFYNNDFYRNIKTVFTIHNIAYQGIYNRDILENVFDINSFHFYNGTVENDGLINIMKAAIVLSDKVMTVSETYAQEIKTDYYGEGLNHILNIHADKLVGILNGIDFDYFNPETDEHIFKKYSVKTLENKAQNKKGLLKLCGLDSKKDVPVIGIISRLVSHKGLDLIEAVINEIASSDVKIIILGQGEWKYENMFINLEKEYPSKVSTHIAFSDDLAKKMYAGCDMLLMPSKSEPCGIAQMIAMRYGTVPIVRETGGLYDTVKPLIKENNTGNGFTFKNYNAHDMLHVIREACYIYTNEKDTWKDLMERCMTCDNSWNASAQKYLDIYKSLL